MVETLSGSLIESKEIDNASDVPATRGEEENVNDIATRYIIPISVIFGFALATVTICCVCYRRWRFAVRTRQ